MAKMNPEVKGKWIEALESGRYEQGRSFLKTGDNKFCCLGVLCDIIDSSKWEAWIGEKHYFYEQHSFALPLDIREQVNLYSEDEDHLITMNDGGESFKTIAQWIKDNL